MDKSQKTILNNKIQINKNTHYMIYLYNILENVHQCRQEMGVQVWEEGITKETKGTFGGDGHVHFLNCGDGSTSMCKSEFITSYNLNMCHYIGQFYSQWSYYKHTKKRKRK